MAEQTSPPDRNQRKEIMQKALQLAVSEQPSEQAQLLERLGRDDFLDSLDSAEDYQAPPTALRVAKILQKLAANSSAPARATLVGLTTKTAFLSARPRQKLLVLVLAELRPAPAEAVQFWRQHARPGAILRHSAVSALADNGSEPAIALFEEILLDPRHPDREKLLWMRDPILRHRTETLMLRMCDRLVRSSLDLELRLHLLDAITDYRPEQWYLECSPPEAQPWIAAPPASRQLMGELGRWSLDSLHLEERTVMTIKRTLAEVGGPPAPANR